MVLCPCPLALEYLKTNEGKCLKLSLKFAKVSLKCFFSFLTCWLLRDKVSFDTAVAVRHHKSKSGGLLGLCFEHFLVTQSYDILHHLF